MNIPLPQADKFASKLIDELSPYCHRIKVAGSIRRRRPTVHDIDLVVIPKDIEALKARCAQRCEIITNGRQNIIIKTSTGIQIDIYIAHLGRKELFQAIPSNWGSILLCRTGSKAHNQRIALAAKAQAKHWNPYIGIVDQEGKIASETEEAIYAALDIPFIKPEDREV